MKTGENTNLYGMPKDLLIVRRARQITGIPFPSLPLPWERREHIKRGMLCIPDSIRIKHTVMPRACFN